MMNTFNEFRLSYGDLLIDLHQAAPLLGYENLLPDDILAIVKEVMEEVSGCFDIRGGYRIFDQVVFAKDNDYRLYVGGMEFNPQKIVYQHLKRSEQVAVFVCTVGNDIEKWSKQIMAANEPLKGFIADILGSVVVEAAIDAVQHNLASAMAGKGLKITNRYSPGYCGWPTVEQHKLFSLLPDGVSGIRLTESALMQPIKSVSGFIGIGRDVRFNSYTCNICDATFCVYRNRKTSQTVHV